MGDGFPRQKDKEEVKNDKVVVKLKKIETEEIVNKKVKEIVNKKVIKSIKYIT